MYTKEEKVFIPSEGVSAIVKDIDVVENRFKLTYYERSTDKRKTDWFKYEQIKPYKKPLEIKIKYFSDIDKIEKISVGDWIDLRSAEDVELKTGEYKPILLGVGMKLPRGYEANVVPRSSTFKNFGVIQTNSFGVVDNTYSGDTDQWKFPALAMRDTVIKKNDRICQFRIQRVQPKVTFIEVDNLDEVSRGGFGSTGTK